MYKGNFDNDLRNGFGELYEGAKMVYRGFWKNGEQSDEDNGNSDRLESKTSKAFTKTSSQIYNRKTGSAQKLNRYEDFGINFNPEDRLGRQSRNQSATRRKNDL